MEKARLIFEDGTTFDGTIFASIQECCGEVVFNTAMSGYQEVLTDPSYAGQMVVMTYPLIGNYGINSEDAESRGLFLSALLIREYIDFPSNWRSEKPLKQYLDEHNIIGVEGLDTRALTRYVRDKGAQKALITTSDEPIEKLIDKLRKSPDMKRLNLAQTVSTKSVYSWELPKTTEYKVAVIDCGVKYNILRMLQDNNCACDVFPLTVDSEQLLSGKYDGVFLSNGPGDPEAVQNVIDTLQEILGKIPIFGICLGHQLLGIAYGGRSYKLKFGHHGINHPVKNLKSGHVEITSQNHGFCVDLESLDNDKIEITHINLNDGTVEGYKHKKYPAFSVQYHPEAGPGPHDSRYLFEEFTKMMDVWKGKKG